MDPSLKISQWEVHIEEGRRGRRQRGKGEIERERGEEREGGGWTEGERGEGRREGGEREGERPRDGGREGRR